MRCNSVLDRCRGQVDTGWAVLDCLYLLHCVYVTKHCKNGSERGREWKPRCCIAEPRGITSQMIAVCKHSQRSARGSSWLPKYIYMEQGEVRLLLLSRLSCNSAVQSTTSGESGMHACGVMAGNFSLPSALLEVKFDPLLETHHSLPY